MAAEAAQSYSPQRLSEGKDPKLKLFIRLPREHFSSDQADSLKDKIFDILGAIPVEKYEPHISQGYCFLYFESRLLAAQAHDKLFKAPINNYEMRPLFGFTRTEQRAVENGIKDEEIERNHRTLFCRNFPKGTVREDVEAVFGQFGEIAKCTMITSKNGLSAFVLYKQFTPVQRALQDFKDGVDFKGQKIDVALSENRNLERRVQKFSQAQGQWGGGPPGGNWGPYSSGPGWGGPGYGHQPMPWGGPQNQWSGGWNSGRGRGRGFRGRGA